jgi:hypothetical protein
MGSETTGFEGVVVGIALGVRPAPHDEVPDTLDAPRDRLGLVDRVWLGCKLFWPGEVPRPTTLSSSSLLGVGTGMERRRYCSVGMRTSGADPKFSVGLKAAVLGWNSCASGLKEKFIGDAMGERLSSADVGDGGTSVLDARDMCLDVAVSLPA